MWNNLVILNVICLHITLLQIVSAAHENVNNTYSVNTYLNDQSAVSKVLSRRKRFLVFPDGSSFQFVFCTQNMGYLQLGDIVWFGNTAALAWELPTDPDFLLKLKKYEKFPQRRQDNKHIYYLGEQGQLVAKVPYKRPHIVNPAFAKRSVNEPAEVKRKTKINRKAMHETQRKREHLNLEQFSESTVRFHRSNRFEVLDKIEIFMTSLGHDGRQCTLRKLCEFGQLPSEQGTFLQEILQVLFTIPKGSNYDEAQHIEFEKAHNSKGDCKTVYPDC